MYRDPDEPTSELYRLMPPRRPRSELREALDAARGDAPAAAGDDAASWPAPARQWPRRLGRALSWVDTWTLIVTTVGVIVAAAGVVIA